MDPEELQPVGRRTRPVVWVGAWAIGLAVVIAIARVGSIRDAPVAPSTPAAVTSSAVAAVAASAQAALTASAEATPSHLTAQAAAPPPVPARPPLGEDGLVGGLVFGTNWPPD